MKRIGQIFGAFCGRHLHDEGRQAKAVRQVNHEDEKQSRYQNNTQIHSIRRVGRLLKWISIRQPELGHAALLIACDLLIGANAAVRVDGGVVNRWSTTPPNFGSFSRYKTPSTSLYQKTYKYGYFVCILYYSRTVAAGQPEVFMWTGKNKLSLSEILSLSSGACLWPCWSTISRLPLIHGGEPAVYLLCKNSYIFHVHYFINNLLSLAISISFSVIFDSATLWLISKANFLELAN